MENFTENDKKRLSTLLKEVYDSFVDKLTILDKKSQDVEHKMEILNPKLQSHLKSKCAQEFAWIEKNGKIVTKDGITGIDINDDAKPYAEENFKKWEKCTNENDFGFRQNLAKVEDNFQNVQNDQQECMNKCITSLNSKNDNEVKDCFKGCFNSFFDFNLKTLSDTLNNIEEIERKI
jgi:hypothetical protein